MVRVTTWLECIADNYIQHAGANIDNENYGAETTIAVHYATATEYEGRALLRFNLPKLHQYKVIRAELHFRVFQRLDYPIIVGQLLNDMATRHWTEGIGTVTSPTTDSDSCWNYYTLTNAWRQSGGDFNEDDKSPPLDLTGTSPIGWKYIDITEIIKKRDELTTTAFDGSEFVEILLRHIETSQSALVSIRSREYTTETEARPDGITSYPIPLLKIIYEDIRPVDIEDVEIEVSPKDVKDGKIKLASSDDTDLNIDEGCYLVERSNDKWSSSSPYNRKIMKRIYDRKIESFDELKLVSAEKHLVGIRSQDYSSFIGKLIKDFPTISVIGAGSGSGLVAGTYYYTATYRTYHNGEYKETAVGDHFDSVTLGAPEDIEITITSHDAEIDDVIAIRIYRNTSPSWADSDFVKEILCDGSTTYIEIDNGWSKSTSGTYAVIDEAKSETGLERHFWNAGEIGSPYLQILNGHKEIYSFPDSFSVLLKVSRGYFNPICIRNLADPDVSAGTNSSGIDTWMKLYFSGYLTGTWDARLDDTKKYLFDLGDGVRQAEDYIATKLTVGASSIDTSLTVEDTSRFKVGDYFIINDGSKAHIRKIGLISGNVITISGEVANNIGGSFEVGSQIMKTVELFYSSHADPHTYSARTKNIYDIEGDSNYANLILVPKNPLAILKVNSFKTKLLQVRNGLDSYTEQSNDKILQFWFREIDKDGSWGNWGYINSDGMWTEVTNIYNDDIEHLISIWRTEDISSTDKEKQVQVLVRNTANKDGGKAYSTSNGLYNGTPIVNGSDIDNFVSYWILRTVRINLNTALKNGYTSQRYERVWKTEVTEGLLKDELSFLDAEKLIEVEIAGTAVDDTGKLTDWTITPQPDGSGIGTPVTDTVPNDIPDDIEILGSIHDNQFEVELDLGEPEGKKLRGIITTKPYSRAEGEFQWGWTVRVLGNLIST